MQYIKAHLLQNEKVLLFVRPHWVVFSTACWAIAFSIYLGYYAPQFLSVRLYNQWTLVQIAAIFFAAIGVYWLIQAFIFYSTSEYGVTNKRVIMKTGWISRSSLEILVEKVEGVLVDQTVMGRIFNYGSITIIGTGGTKDRFSFIPNPLFFRKMVQQQIENIEEGRFGE